MPQRQLPFPSEMPNRPSVFESVATFALIAALLYLGAGILVPLVLAILLAFALAPLVTWFNRRLHLPDPVAVILAVALALTALGGFAFISGTQVAKLAAELPGYQETIIAKMSGLQEQFGNNSLIDQINGAIERLTTEMEGAGETRPGAPIPVTISNEIGPLGILSSVLGSIIGPVATVAIVAVFLIFLLMGRGDLQERFIRLVSAGRYSKTNMAIADASQRVGRYLLIQLAVNTVYGTIFGIGLWLIGVPSAVLWGLLIILFRYIPFVGALIIAMVPFLLAFAVDPGWNMLLLSVGLFLVLDLTTANVIEPRLYGSSTGVSAIAILLSAMFWATMWGPVGLILATPMTVCLVVIGRHLPQFQFLETLLGSEPVLSPPERLYQRMLRGNTEDAIEMTEDHIEAHDTQHYLDEVMMPALRLASSELADGPEALPQRRQLVQSFEALVDEVAKVDWPEQSALLLIGGRTEIDECAATLLGIRLANEGIASRVLPPVAIRQEAIGRLDLDGVEAVVLVFMGDDIRAQTRYAARRIRRMAPDTRVIVCALHESSAQESAETLHVDTIFRTMDDAVEGALVNLHQLEISELHASGKVEPFAGAGRGDDALGQAIEQIADAFGIPFATINLLHDDRHAEDEAAFRLTTIVAETRKPLIVQSQTPHPLVGDNAYLQTNGIDLYAAVPLILDDGSCIGALALLDYEPREFGPEDIAQLQAAADDLVQRFGQGGAVAA
ncbi:MAG: AI-2E family transporter [Alphaproteobacteria bacterium]|nr:AI-2E family transporter [Alphaproteobacteria bacterium]MBU1559921.1 AI-2E family transporter [Alphaproteobacteria bacterium]MBU2302223.1 AI-2E family transporter [Alphaproteobacteria bacterium]MBU2369477.1 AI-2E family transporter [Alphaproteobacteria bacterium]